MRIAEFGLIILLVAVAAWYAGAPELEEPVQIVPAVAESRGVWLSAYQLCDKPPSTLEQVYVEVSLGVREDQPAWRTPDLLCGRVKWHNLLDLTLVDDQGRRVELDTGGIDIRRLHRHHSLQLAGGQQVSHGFSLGDLQPYSSDWDRQALDRAFREGRLSLEVRLATTLYRAQDEAKSFARVVSLLTVSIPLEHS